MAVKSTKAGSIKALRASVERKGGGNEAFLQRVPADDSIMVRFLTEPEEWQSYFEHYDQVMRYYPCSDDCPGCTEGARPSQRYLANVYDVGNDRVVPMVLPKSLVTKLLNSYDRYKTITDRDYELIRLGSGLDTDYDRSPEAPSKRPVKHDQLDLEEVLENQLKRAFDNDDEDEAPPARRGASRPGTGTGKSNPAPKPTKRPAAAPVEEEPDEDDDDGVTAPPDVDRAELEEMSLRELRVYAKSEMGIDAADIRGLDQDALVELIVARAEDTALDAPTTTTTEDDDDPDAADEDAEDATPEGDADDSEELTEEQIREMSIAELRKLCNDMEITWKRTDGKALLVKKVLDSVPDDDEDEPPF